MPSYHLTHLKQLEAESIYIIREVVAEFEFLSDDPFAQRVKNAWDKGFLQAASVSWLPLETAPAPGGGWRDTRADLLEWSIVSVPADPDTLKEAHRRRYRSNPGITVDIHKP